MQRDLTPPRLTFEGDQRAPRAAHRHAIPLRSARDLHRLRYEYVRVDFFFFFFFFLIDKATQTIRSRSARNGHVSLALARHGENCRRSWYRQTSLPLFSSFLLSCFFLALLFHSSVARANVTSTKQGEFDFKPRGITFGFRCARLPPLTHSNTHKSSSSQSELCRRVSAVQDTACRTVVSVQSTFVLCVSLCFLDWL